MKPTTPQLTAREGMAAVRVVLEQLSFVRAQDIRMDPSPADRRIGLLVTVNVFGRAHRLACALHGDSFTDGIEAAMFEIHAAASALGSEVLAVMIVPEMSGEAQARCRQHHIAYLDLIGNAYLDVGDIFVARRAIQPRKHESAPHAQLGASPASRAPDRGPSDALPA